ncbi:MAG: UvrD-helicase domain-containing protein, partial [Deltaproteobacteria bacterium]
MSRWLTCIPGWGIVPHMKFLADLHVHSRFSRATSRNLDPEHLALWGKKKGITLIGTGDFTHAGWLSELQDKLIEAENGLYRLKPELETSIEREVPASCQKPTRFVLSGEISCIYKREGNTRKIHHLILMPDMDAVFRLNKKLDRIGNLSSDGRPILGLDSRDLLEIVLEVSERAFFIPAHIWTPWFSLFGSKSGFDAIEECFGDLTSHIHALETGLSSDPPMNRRLSAIDKYLLVSNSDAHSPAKLGREANIFDTALDYDKILQAMIQRSGFEGTIEFFPEEGKYHFDGHRKCQVRFHPKETRAHDGLCPSCGKPLTIGVLHRVEALSDRDKPQLSKDFYCLIPLTEILSEIFDCGPSTKRVASTYEDLLVALGPELHILMDARPENIEKAGGVLLSKAIHRMRQNQVIREEGYDGEYGTIRLFEEAERDALVGQCALFHAPKREKPGLKKEFRDEGVAKKKKETPQHPDHTLPSDPILGPLNPEQREAVLHYGSHLIVVAGPGTGKTMTLSHRIAHLIQSGHASPSQVLALTFTNKAAREMEERISNLLPEQAEGAVWVSTFHGFCLQVLRKEGENLSLPPSFNVCSELDVPILVKRVISESGGEKRIANKLMKELPRLKIASVMVDKKAPDHSALLPYFESYQQKLRELGMFDLDDLQVETLRLFYEFPEICSKYAERFLKIFVDEYQDTNSVQVALLKALIQMGSGEICAIGDPDQAIYGFRGANLENFYRFSEDFPGAKEVKLSKNYRSSQVILSGSSGLMRRQEPLRGVLGGGDPIRFASCRTHAEEAEMIVEQIEKLLGGTTYFSLDSGRVSSHEDGENFGFGDIAVLFRLNAQGDGLQEALARAGIPFIRSGEKPLIHRYPANIVWRFLHALQYPENPYHLKTYLDLPDVKNLDAKELLRRCETEESLEDLIDKAATLHEFDLSSEDSAETLRRMKATAANFQGDLKSFLDILSVERGIDLATLSGDRVALMSLHAAKGLEWPVVFITGCEEGLIPCTLFGDRDEEEEKRLFYVGMTRARSKLMLSSASRRTINGRVLQMKPSPYLGLIPG